MSEFKIRKMEKSDEKQVEKIWTDGIIVDEFAAFEPILQRKPNVIFLHTIGLALGLYFSIFISLVLSAAIYLIGSSQNYLIFILF